ncbi:MAG: hypothetical protein Q9160_001999 [Pyrenula sp. 1 TL-2023]
MFRWYQDASRCYVYLADVSISDYAQKSRISQPPWEQAFSASRWFTRGWTLQELLAPGLVEFFSQDGKLLGDKRSLERQIHGITGICIQALRGAPLSHVDVAQRLSWAERRQTTRAEDAAYSLLGIFDVHMPLIYGEGRERAFSRLKRKIDKASENSVQDCTLMSFGANHLMKTPFYPDKSVQQTSTPEGSNEGQHIERQAHNKSHCSPTSLRDSEPRWRPPLLSEDCCLVESNELEATKPYERTQRQTLGSIKTLVERTQQAMVLRDDYWQSKIVQLYGELGRHQERLEHLSQMLSSYEATRRKKPGMFSESENLESLMHCERPRGSDESSTHTEPDVTDIFFDCISRFSQDDSQESIERSRALFSGSPDYTFEAQSTFFPEQYTVISSFAGVMIVVAIVELQRSETNFVQKYFLTYIETPRKWRKVTVTADIKTTMQNSLLAEMASRESLVIANRTFPAALETQLHGVLGSIRLPETVAMISLTITEDESGYIDVDTESLEVREDSEEANSNHLGMIKDIEDMGCPRFLKSEMVLRSRYSPCHYIVQIGSRLYIEKLSPFKGSRNAEHNDLGRFFEEIRFARSLRECNGVAEFAGVVLDETGKTLESYLCEYPTLGRLHKFFDNAEMKNGQVPWEAREIWAKQIIKTSTRVPSSFLTVAGLKFPHIWTLSLATVDAAIQAKGYPLESF